MAIGLNDSKIDKQIPQTLERAYTIEKAQFTSIFKRLNRKCLGIFLEVDALRHDALYRVLCRGTD